MSLYARQLNINDLERSLAVETAAFPPAEAATREKVVRSITDPKTTNFCAWHVEAAVRALEGDVRALGREAAGHTGSCTGLHITSR